MLSPGRKDGWDVGACVPGIVSSPFARRGAIDSTEYETVSILKLMICLQRLESRCYCQVGELMSKRVRTRFEKFSFGSIRIDGITYEHDVVIDRGNIRKRNKKPSKKFRDTYGHTPLSVDEEIPWKCERLVVGTGTGALPVMDEV